MSAQANKMMPSQKFIISLLKELDIMEYEPRVVNQLLEFTYRYIAGILEDARVYANHGKKKNIDLDDVKLAATLQMDRVFTSPPSRDILMDIARAKNSQPLPFVKPHCGVRLPPDRYCLNSCNYTLKSINATKKQSTKPQGTAGNAKGKGKGKDKGKGKGKGKGGGARTKPKSKVVRRGRAGKKTKPFGHNAPGSSSSGGQSSSGKASSGKAASSLSSSSGAKRPGNITTVPRTQSISAPKPTIRFSPGTSGVQKIHVKPKTQISSGQIDVQINKGEKADGFSLLKRKREDDVGHFSGGASYGQQQQLKRKKEEPTASPLFSSLTR